MTKNSQNKLKKYKPKQIWPIQASDGVIRTVEDDFNGYFDRFNSKEAKEFRDAIRGDKEFDAEALREENHERQKKYNIEDIIDFVAYDFYLKIRGIYEANENYSIFQAIEDAHGIIQCNNYASYPSYILDTLEYDDYLNKSKKEMN